MYYLLVYVPIIFNMGDFKMYEFSSKEQCETTAVFLQSKQKDSMRTVPFEYICIRK